MTFVKVDASNSRDGKLSHLKPIVLLERISVGKASTHLHAAAVKKNHVQHLGSNARDSDVKLPENPPTKSGFGINIRRSPGSKRIKSHRKNASAIHITKRVKRADDEEERPYKCSECEERFHTSVLLAVHKRIHDQEPCEETRQESCKETWQEPCKEPPLEPQNAVKVIQPQNEDDAIVTPPPSQVKSVQVAIDNSRTSVESKTNKPIQRAIQRHPCRDCPAHFSRRWYLDLHMTLLHHSSDGNTATFCPACFSICKTEQLLREHVTEKHATDTVAMDYDISLSLGMMTNALTGERYAAGECYPKVPTLRKKVPFLPRREVRSNHRGNLVGMVEDELKSIIQERNQFGDTFNAADIQRWSLEICSSLNIMPFVSGLPSKVWARRVLSSLGLDQKNMRRERLKYNMNYVFQNAVELLTPSGITEDNIYYACKGVLCDVAESKLVSRRSSKPGDGEDNTLTVVLSANASGSVLHEPMVVFQGHLANRMDLNHLNLVAPKLRSRNFIENHYFEAWFNYFVEELPPLRPILLVVEGHVSQMSYQIIRMSREADVNIIFVPCRKYFFHPHRFLRAALMTPLRQAFDKVAHRLLESRGLELCDFGPVFKSAWKLALKKIDVKKGFKDAGFGPIRPSENSTTVSIETPSEDAPSSSSGDTSNEQVSVVTPWRSHWCADCGRGYKELSEWQNHQCIESTDVPSKKASPKRRKCLLCEAKFVDELDLDHHVCAMNQTDKCDLFVCHYCKMCFATWKTLKFHLVKHEHDPSYARPPLVNSQHSKVSSSNEASNDMSFSSERMPHSPSSTSSASSSTSGTLTAQSSDCYVDFECASNKMEFKKEFKYDVGTDQFQNGNRCIPVIPPPPPLPEHDYLGQIYVKQPRGLEDLKGIVKEEPLEP